MGKTTTSTATTDETAEPSPKVVQQLDPRTLLLDRNIRSGDRLDKDLVDSVRQLGVLVTIDAVSTADGGVRVLRGHGRTRAAIEAQRETVPVIIHGVEGTTDAAEVERIIGQHAENAHRTDLTHGEQVAVVDQLTAFGVSAAQIVKRTRIKRDQVDAALAVGRSELATNAVERYSFLDLTQAATLAEFEDDEETVTALVAAAKTGRFDHVAQRARDNRDRAQRRAAHAEALTAQGITVVTGGEVGRPLYALRTADGEHITPDTHTACPGHAAQVTMTWGYLDPATGYPIPQDDATDTDDDEGGDGHPDDEPSSYTDDPGPETVYGQHPVTEWVCTDPAGNGHVDAYDTGSGSGRQKLSEMAPDQAEAERAERRDVRESNAAWDSAQTVRRSWLRDTLCARKTPPTGAAAFLTTTVALDAPVLSHHRRNEVVAELLGVEHYGAGAEVAALAAKASDKRAQVLALTLVLAAYEASASRHDWRHVQASTGRYLTFLDACGYVRSDVERRACGEDPLPDLDVE